MPASVSLAEVEDEGEEESEGMRRTISATCRNCENTMAVLTPEGYKYSFVPNKFTQDEDEDEEESEDEDEDESEGDSRRGTSRPVYRRKSSEAVRTFRRVYEGRSDAAAFATDAVSAFRESYRDATAHAREIKRFHS